jgi:hypothetical protein
MSVFYIESKLRKEKVNDKIKNLFTRDFDGVEHA